MIVSINVNEEVWKRLIKKYPQKVSTIINFFLKKLDEGKFPNIEELLAK